MINKINRLVHKKSFENGVWLYLLQFFNMVLPLVTLPYITRILGASRYGSFSIALNIIGYLQVVVEYGFELHASREVATKGKKYLSKHFTTVIATRFLLTGLCVLIGIIYACVNIDEYEISISFIILLMCLLGYCFQMNWIFQGLQEMRFISIVNVLTRTISTILIFFIVKTDKNLFLYCFLYSLSPLLSGWISCLLAKKRYNLDFVRIRVTDIIDELKSSFYVFTVHMSSRIFGSIGITFLAVFSNNVEVGIFSAIQKIPNLLIALWAPINQVIYPISSKYFSKSIEDGVKYVSKIRSYIIPFFTIGVLILSVASKGIVELMYGQEYAVFFYWIIPLLFWVLISIDNNFWGIQILLANGFDKEYGKVFQIGVVTTIFINGVFIYYWKGFGASIAPVASELVFNLLLRKTIRDVIK